MKKVLGIVLFLLLYFCAAYAELDVYFVDVGQADATIITCDGEVMMIDGGNAADSSLIYSLLRNTLGIDRINCMVATHPHEDHIGGLSGALNACRVDLLLTPVAEYDSRQFASLMKYAGQQDTVVRVPEGIESFYLGDALVQIIPPQHAYSDVNNDSIFVKVSYGDTTFLFTGDAEKEAELDMIEVGIDLKADLLQVGHHGSKTSSSEEFLGTVAPKYAVISSGEGNSYGHPHEEVLNRLDESGVIIARTDSMGTIKCTSDGTQLRFA